MLRPKRPFRAALHSLLAALIMAIGGFALPLMPIRWRPAFKRWMCRCGIYLLGITLRKEGEPIEGPALIVSNHCSYLDILILQSLAEFSFTPKSEIEHWPIIGKMAKSFGAVFVDRSPGRTKDVGITLLNHLHQGRRICLFPEATTNDGRTMKPFRSSLFSLAETWDGEQPLAVQPVSLRYETFESQPIQDADWEKIAWYGDVDLMTHMFQAYGNQGLEVRAIFHPPLYLQAGQSRKDLCHAAEAIIRETVMGPSLVKPA